MKKKEQAAESRTRQGDARISRPEPAAGPLEEGVPVGLGWIRVTQKNCCELLAGIDNPLVGVHIHDYGYGTAYPGQAFWVHVIVQARCGIKAVTLNVIVDDGNGVWTRDIVEPIADCPLRFEHSYFWGPASIGQAFNSTPVDHRQDKYVGPLPDRRQKIYGLDVIARVTAISCCNDDKTKEEDKKKFIDPDEPF